MNEGIIQLIPADTFLFNGNVSEEKIEACQNFLLSKQEGEGNHKTIILNTYGGDVYDAFGLASFMKIIPHPIRIICIGKIMSCGLIILTGGTEVFSFETTRFMIHDADLGEGLVDRINVKHVGKNIEELNKIMYKQIAGRSPDYDSEFFTKLGSNETYFSAEEALTWGVIDGII